MLQAATAECCSSSNFPEGGGAALGFRTAVYSLANEGRIVWKGKGTSFLPPVPQWPARSIPSTSLWKLRKARMEIFVQENHLLVYIPSFLPSFHPLTRPSIPQIFITLQLCSNLSSRFWEATENKTKILALLELTFWLGTLGEGRKLQMVNIKNMQIMCQVRSWWVLWNKGKGNKAWEERGVWWQF